MCFKVENLTEKEDYPWELLRYISEVFSTIHHKYIKDSVDLYVDNQTHIGTKHENKLL